MHSGIRMHAAHKMQVGHAWLRQVLIKPIGIFCYKLRWFCKVKISQHSSSSMLGTSCRQCIPAWYLLHRKCKGNCPRMSEWARLWVKMLIDGELEGHFQHQIIEAFRKWPLGGAWDDLAGTLLLHVTKFYLKFKLLDPWWSNWMAGDCHPLPHQHFTHFEKKTWYSILSWGLGHLDWSLAKRHLAIWLSLENDKP